jgi:hypothetical protein
VVVSTGPSVVFSLKVAAGSLSPIAMVMDFLLGSGWPRQGRRDGQGL